LVIVGGGDGTLNAAVEGCQQQPRERSACQIMLYFA
jgi:diacylglycerol kinase family enzyme